MDETRCCGCAADTPDLPRRRVIKLMAAGLGGSALIGTAAAQANPTVGDRLVEDGAEGPPAPLKLDDLRPGKPLLAFPFDLAAGKARDETRLNKVVLMRFDPAALNDAQRARAAGGVLAFSAICTHQACDVKTWLSKEEVLVCFCHASKFRVLEDAKVVSGPATRALPSLPLKLEADGSIAIAGGFSATPGGA